MVRKGCVFLAAGAVLLTAVGFAGGFFLGNSAAARAVLPASVAQAIGINQPPEGVDLTPVWKAWATIDEKFVPASVASD